MNYLSEARRHLERIEHYYQYAGSIGYKQSTYHYYQLCALAKSANDSKGHKNDTSIILQLKQRADELMNYMKEK
jgi:hypothetical protein